MALIQFDRLMSERAILPFYQPIVRTDDLATIGFEVLGRSPLFGLKNPAMMFQAAAQLNLEAELSRLCRWVGLEKADRLPGSPVVFLNTHPTELLDRDVLELSLQEIRDAFSNVQLILEIHEASVSDPDSMRALRATLDGLNIGLAYDDFGSGQARLIELIEVPPDVLKFDIAFIREIDRATTQRQRMLASLVRMVRDLGIQALAEGMETEGEARVCVDLGFDLNQGYYYGEPAPARAICGA
jgi:EAL domain-containing protein (putative c-di-GMP-specific phosphodiesterase class I)